LLFWALTPCRIRISSIYTSLHGVKFLKKIIFAVTSSLLNKSKLAYRIYVILIANKELKKLLEISKCEFVRVESKLSQGPIQPSNEITRTAVSLGSTAEARS
jgi:hypothetical protein